MKIFLASLGLIIGLAVLVGGGWAIRYYTAEVRGVVGAEEQIQSAPSRIANYNYFFDLCAAIQGHEASLGAQARQLDQVTTERERNRILANIAGLEGQRARSIARYNQDARKEYTRGQFRDSQLPYQLSEGADTSC